MSESSVERAVRSARRRLAGQLLLDRVARGWVVALAAALAWALIDPARWWVGPGLLVAVAAVALARTARDYPSRLAAALELDARFGLHERTTAALGLGAVQRDTPVGRAVAADAEEHAAALRVGDRFPLRLPRAWPVPVLAAAVAVVLLWWHPITDSDWFTPDSRQPDVAARPSDTAPSPANPFPRPDPNAPEKSAAERVAALRAELDRLEQQARDGKSDDARWSADLTAAADDARATERDALDRLARMEAQLKQLDRLADEPEFKAGPGRDAAASLAAGDLERAEKALEELARAAAEKPNDPQLQKQLERLGNELRKAADNTAAREKLDALIEQAKKDGRDTSGLEQERDRVAAEGNDSKPLRDAADRLDAAAERMRKGEGAEAGKELDRAAAAVRAVRDQARAAQEARGQAERAEQLRADAAKSGRNAGAGGLSAPRPPGTEPTAPAKDLRARVPFVDPKGAATPAGSGDRGGGFTKTDPAKLGPAIQQAAQSAPAAVAGQPLSRDDRDAVREFFERLGK